MRSLASIWRWEGAVRLGSKSSPRGRRRGGSRVYRDLACPNLQDGYVPGCPSQPRRPANTASNCCGLSAPSFRIARTIG